MADFEDKDAGWEALLNEFARRGRKPTNLDVGFFTEEMALVATVQEFGSPARNIPPRPFLSTAFDANEKKYDGMLQRAVSRSLERGARIAFAPIGREIRNDIIESIIDWSDPPNAASTQASKGFNNPLVHTGELQRSIEVKISSGEE